MLAELFDLVIRSIAGKGKGKEKKEKARERNDFQQQGASVFVYISLLFACYQKLRFFNVYFYVYLLRF